MRVSLCFRIFIRSLARSVMDNLLVSLMRDLTSQGLHRISGVSQSRKHMCSEGKHGHKHATLYKCSSRNSSPSREVKRTNEVYIQTTFFLKRESCYSYQSVASRLQTLKAGSWTINIKRQSLSQNKSILNTDSGKSGV